MKKIISALVVLVSVLFLTACNGGSSSTVQPVALESNQVQIIVDGGVGNAAPPNRPFVSVTFCVPGTTTCQTIDHVLLDSGSDGLRVPKSILQNSNLYPQLTSVDNTPLYTCANYAAGYDFGSINVADVKLGGLTASSVPFQIIDDSQAQTGIPSSCSDGGRYFDFVGAGQNAIIGVRNWIYDEDTNYACSSSGNCVEVFLPESQQMGTPVIKMAGYNNGAIIQFPNAPANGAVSFTGLLTLGINTATNNTVGSNVDIFYTDSVGFFKTQYNDLIYPSTFDSGTPFITFADESLPLCTGEFGGFYCPPSPMNINAIFSSFSGANSVNASYMIQNPMIYYTNAVTNNTLLPYAAASCEGCESFADTIFLWGLPYFYGKSIYSIFPGAVVNGESAQALGVGGI